MTRLGRVTRLVGVTRLARVTRPARMVGLLSVTASTGGAVPDKKFMGKVDVVSWKFWLVPENLQILLSDIDGQYSDCSQ